MDRDTDTISTEAMSLEESVPIKRVDSPPTVLTSTTNLIHFQKHLKDLVKENFEYRSSRNLTRVISKNVAVFQPSDPASKTIICPASYVIRCPKSTLIIPLR
jgi:hypothetical protein